MSEPPLADLSELFEGEWECLSKVYGWNSPLLTTIRSGGFEFSVLDESGNRIRYPGTYETWFADVPVLGQMPGLTLNLGDGMRFPGYRNSLRFYYDLERLMMTDFQSIAFVKWQDLHRVRDAWHARGRTPAEEDLGNWQLVWETSFEEYEFDYGVSVLDIVGEHRGDIATVTDDALLILDRRGRERSRFEIPEESGHLVNWGVRSMAAYLVTYGTWIDPIISFDSRGDILWRSEHGHGIDDVAPIRIDAAKTGMIVGYNGRGGIEVFDPLGQIVVKIEGLTNVFSVCSAKFSDEFSDCILGVDGGHGSAFSIAGEKLAHYESVGEVSAICAMDLDGDGRDEVLTLGTVYAIGTNLSAFTAEGKLLWSTMIDADDRWVKHPLYRMDVQGKAEIAFATKTGVTFYSFEGSLTNRIAIEITGAVRMPHQGMSDRLLLRGHGFLKCLELADG